MIVGLLRTPETSTIWCDDNLERQTQPASRPEYEGCAPTKTATTLCRTIGKLACFGTSPDFLLGQNRLEGKCAKVSDFVLWARTAPEIRFGSILRETLANSRA